MTRLFAGMIAAAACIVFAGVAEANDKAQQVKTAFLFNFTKYVGWPNEGQAFVLGVVGDAAYGKAVAEALHGKEGGAGRIRVVQLPAGALAEEIARCQLVYLGAGEAGRLDELLEALKGKPVLTVSDIEGFADKGGGIGFVTTTRIGLEINKRPIEAGGMKISAKLLQLASKVID